VVGSGHRSHLAQLPSFNGVAGGSNNSLHASNYFPDFSRLGAIYRQEDGMAKSRVARQYKHDCRAGNGAPSWAMANRDERRRCRKRERQALAREIQS
jgi:hypothetical protein